MNRLDPVEKTQMKESVPDIQPGDTVRVHVRIKESETKERIQIFEGLVIAKRLTELHGGKLSIQSTPGEGTTVTIKIPNPPAA